MSALGKVNGDSGARRPRIGYLLRMYPRFSQTFVVNEILELERQGTDVHILSLRKPTDGRFQEVICQVRAAVDYVPEHFVEARGKFARAHWSACGAAPRHYARAAGSVLRHAGAQRVDMRQAALVLRMARKRKLDHVHVHFGTGEATVAWLADLMGGLSYSLTLHAFDIFRENVDRRLLAAKINASRFTVTVSEFNRRWMIANLPGVDPERIRVNYNGIDLERFRPAEQPGDPLHILGVGRLIEKKGFGYLVQAVGRLREQGVPATSTIVGDGPHTDALRAEIRRLGLEGAVTLAGPRPQNEVRSLLAASGCFALPCVEARDGNVDALPTVLLEAMACACPCVSTSVSGVPEIIDHERTGLLVPPHDVPALAAALRRVLCSADLRARMAAEGRLRAERLFDVRSNVARMRSWFEDLLPDPPKAPKVPRDPEAREVESAEPARLSDSRPVVGSLTMRLFKTLRGKLDLGEMAGLRRRFGRYVRPHRGKLAVAFLAGLGATAAQVAAPWPIKLVFDVVLTDAMAGTRLGRWFAEYAAEPTTALAVLCVLIMLIALAQSTFSYVRDVLMARTGQEVVGKLRESLFRHMQRLSPDVYERRRTGDLLMRLTGDIQMLRQLLVNIWITACQNALTIVLILAVMFWLNPLLAAIATAAIPLMAWASAVIGRRLRTVTATQREKESFVASVAHEVFGAMTVVQAFNREKIESQRFARQNRSSIRAGLKATRLEARLFRVVSLTSAAAMCAVLFFGVRSVLNETMTAGDLLLFVAYVRAVHKPLRKLSKLTGQAAKATTCGARIAEIMSIPPTISDAPDAEPAAVLSGSVELQNLGFSYPDGTPALRDVQLAIAPGERVAIVGHSGAGKSTLVKLLLRFYDPTSGAVCLDGRDIRKYTVASLRDNVGVVQQDTVLFGLTIAENIALGRENVDMKSVRGIAREVGAAAFIEALPDGYDTTLSEGGTTLSGGQRQRLALARALLRKAPILILDEPVSGLDAEVARVAEEAWMDPAKQRTVLVICHHFLSMERYDRIVVLQEGRLVDSGGHAELLDRCPVYKRAYEAWQARNNHDGPTEDPQHASGVQRLAC